MAVSQESKSNHEENGEVSLLVGFAKPTDSLFFLSWRGVDGVGGLGLCTRKCLAKVFMGEWKRGGGWYRDGNLVMRQGAPSESVLLSSLSGQICKRLFPRRLFRHLRFRWNLPFHQEEVLD